MWDEFNYAAINLGLIGDYAVCAAKNFVKKNDKFAQIEERHALNVILQELSCGATNTQRCQELQDAVSLLI